MLLRTFLTRSLARSLASRTPLHRPIRCITTQPDRQDQQQKSWLTRKVESSPTAKKWFLKFTGLLGYGSPKQLAGRRAFILYEHVVATTPDQDTAFWQNGTPFPDVIVLISPHPSSQNATSHQHSSPGSQ